MTILGDEIFISTDHFVKYYRLPVSENKDTFIINSSKTSVSCIQISDQKLLQMWNLAHPESFTSPAIFWPNKNVICCIVDCKKLLTWDVASENLKTAEKQKLNSPAFTLVHLEGNSPLIIFCNGTSILVEEIKANSQQASSLDFTVDEELIWADASSIETNIIVLLVTKNKKTNQHSLRSYILKNGTMDNSSVRCISLNQNSLSLHSYCLFNNQEEIKFLTVWQNGEVYSYSTDKGDSEFLFQVSNVNNKISLTIDVIKASYLAVAKYSASLSGTIEIWDLKYQILKETKTLTRELSKSLQIKALQSTLFLSLVNGMIIMPVTVEPSTLLGVVGRSNIDSKLNFGNTVSWSDEEKSEDTFSKEVLFSIDFENLMKNDTLNAKECIEYLEKTNDVSEEHLIQILKKVLKEHNEPDKDLLFRTIFRTPFSDIFLRQHLKQLSLTETLIVVNKLQKILNDNLFCTQNSEGPTDLQIITWLQLIIQVHFETMLLSPDEDVKELLKNLQTSLLNKMDVYTELEELKNLLMMTHKKKSIIPEKYVRSKYCIETLNL